MQSGSTSADSPLRISIILPVYNVEDYLQECLQSIIDQSFESNVEVLLVDDCSTDHSRQICAEFAELHPDLFTLIASDANQGVSVARNIGLDNARGDYFMFVDSDDVLAPGALQSLYSAATEHAVDIVKGNNSIFDDSREKNANHNVTSQSIINGDDILTALYAHDKLRGHPWGKLFNRNRLGHIRFPVGVRMAEDLQYCGGVFSEASSLLLLNKSVYRYRKMDTGTTGRKFESGAYLDWLSSVEKIGVFAVDRTQRNAHRGLQVRTMTEIARECRKIPTTTAREVLVTIDQKCNAWNIRLIGTILSGGAGFGSLWRYLKLQLALLQIRRKLSQ